MKCLGYDQNCLTAAVPIVPPSPNPPAVGAALFSPSQSREFSKRFFTLEFSEAQLLITYYYDFLTRSALANNCLRFLAIEVARALHWYRVAFLAYLLRFRRSPARRGDP